MNKSPDKATFILAEKELDITAPLIEKDWHVTQVLAFLSRLNYPGFEIVFSGGTALSKAHKLIQRFSEDIDFRVIAAEDKLHRNVLSAFKNSVINSLRDAGFHIAADSIRARDGNKFFAIDIDYNTYFDHTIELRPHIQVEMTVHSPQLPVLHLPVKSLLTELMKKPPEVESIACISPVESAADKLSALAWRIPDRVRGNQNDDPSLVRHIHDLAALENIAIKDPNFIELVLAALNRDNSRPRNVSTFNTLSKHEKFALMLDILVRDSEYIEEYRRFVFDVSYAPEGAAPDFETAIKAVKRLADHVLNK